MRKVVHCHACVHRFVHDLPDVSVAEAVHLKATQAESVVMFACPACRQQIHLPHWTLPGLPDPPA